uniref:Plp n=1 Tax=Ganoderma boninense TaxID=34458 RepID=A0A5K1K559_9APHY|nr:Plp [Ganoderma boninense]
MDLGSDLRTSTLSIMQAVKTNLTRLLGIRVPIVCAPMALGTNARTAVEVNRGGGFGFVGAGYRTPESLDQDFAFLRASFPNLESHKPLPIGYGFIGWLLDKNEDVGKHLIDTVIGNGVQAIWLAFGNNLRFWVEYVRASPANAREGRNHKPLIFIQATSVEEALVAANEWKVDVIVAQGGGTRWSQRHRATLRAPLRRSSPRSHKTAPRRPCSPRAEWRLGHKPAAYLTLGASGVVLGTRFLLTPESPYTDAQKAALLAARTAGSGRDRADARIRLREGHGVLAGAHIDGRGLRNALVGDVEAGVDHATVQARWKAATEAGDSSYMVVWAGQGVALMKEIKPIKVRTTPSSHRDRTMMTTYLPTLAE